MYPVSEKKASWVYLVLLILSGEAVFVLPFILQRIFRSTVLEVFQLDNTQLGICFSIYGVVALLSYLFGGPVADRFPPRKLIAVALWLTAAGGLFFALFPAYFWLKVIYGFWGFTTIFLFWAPMIKATRVWGGENSQGKAYGILDGGRGLTGAMFGVMGVLVISLLLPENPDSAPLEVRKEAFRMVIYCSSAIISLIGLMVWFFLKSEHEEEQEISKISIQQVGSVLKLPSVWMLMIVVLCAYVGYKITDDVSLYAREIMGYDEVVSARVGTLLLFIRAAVGIGIGFIADRSKGSLWLFISFCVSAVGGLLFATGIAPAFWLVFLVSVFGVAAGVYASRALYFAVFSMGQVPIKLMGTAVGVVSMIGFTPDIFAGVAMGYLLDSSPGITGHQHTFWMLTVFSLIGMVTAWMFHRKYGRN